MKRRLKQMPADYTRISMVTKDCFQGYRMPEYIAPDNLTEGSKEHALYLTLIISIDYMTDAVKLWRNARGTYRLYPEKFDPQVILGLGERTVTSFVRGLGARYPEAGAKTWRKISKILMEKYGGDPRNLTPEPLTIEQLKTKLRDFPYLRGNKLSNFYLRANRQMIQGPLFVERENTYYRMVLHGYSVGEDR